MKSISVLFFVLSLLSSSCNPKDKSIDKSGNPLYNADTQTDTLSKHLKPFQEGLPTIGLLMYHGVLTTEITAAADVFTKGNEEGTQLFNVITITETNSPIITEEGLKIIGDYTFKNCPNLDVLFVPSAYDMYAQVHNENIVHFIREKDKNTKYTVSNCAGAQLIGESGIADGRKIVTWIGGGEQLQKDYPNLLVQDEFKTTYIEDGKYLSSNGNLASYISALELLEKMTSPAHRKFVESYLYLDRLQDWGKEK
ncbi:DJ-1/PfpI family protein [Algoriphagus sp. NG3]|uniref:DJ-1/PfpI family protein n=1 Tax=Algoriphagus sp. NG3 TaxID=3097546 RepID=UPI002A80B463|nr:DJ-1/PfpI family protein [Algoriphagus sp. NG3]WPR75825.1 DJ-1/PfpI family protein [Algoriphagus sp. NG3]